MLMKSTFCFLILKLPLISSETVFILLNPGIQAQWGTAAVHLLQNLLSNEE